MRAEYIEVALNTEMMQADKELVTIKFTDLIPEWVHEPDVTPVGFIPVELDRGALEERAQNLGYEVVDLGLDYERMLRILQLLRSKGNEISKFSVYEIKGSLHVLNPSWRRFTETFIGVSDQHFYQREGAVG